MGIAKRTKGVEQYYTLGRKLGEGNFAIVKEATHIKTGEKYAVKIVDLKQVSERARKNLKVEIALLKSIRHPNVIYLKEVFVEKNKTYIVMELVNGGELFDYIVEHGQLSEAEASRITGRIAHALAFLHSKGIVHRDLKPENVLMKSPPKDGNPDIMVADFGLSKIASGNSMLKTMCGTPAYLAPELLRNQPYDGSVDMWALGVIVYIMLCGFPPFDMDKPTPQLFDDIIAGRYDFPSPFWDHISDTGKDFVEKLLTVDPEKRLTAKAALQHPWLKKFIRAVAAMRRLSLLTSLKPPQSSAKPAASPRKPAASPRKPAASRSSGEAKSSGGGKGGGGGGGGKGKRRPTSGRK